MKARIVRWCRSIIEALRPRLDERQTVQVLTTRLADAMEELAVTGNQARTEYLERIAELQEARTMFGSGPWIASPTTLERTDAVLSAAYESFNSGRPARLRETTPVGAIGATGDIELALQNVEWKREVNLSLLEFSRWGIQQIILISRLYYLKNPLIRRGVDVCSAYVFGRGFEVTTDNPKANDVLRAFFAANLNVLGQIGLAKLEKQKWYDGNLFIVFFADRLNTGNVTVRTIDATEIQDIITDPEDGDTPWFYKREWVQRAYDQGNGQMRNEGKVAFYPALGYDPPNKPATFGNAPIMWDTPILHRKSGDVGKWHFGCPEIYPALDWAKTSRRLLEACFTVRKSLAQISATLTTKGGQQALSGAKSQLATTVGPTSSLWDTNPTAVDGSIFASGPGTKLEAFKTAGAGGNPEDVRRYIHWVAMVFGIPETFFADASVGSLATAQSLDRPTELRFLERQEAWREDLTRIAQFVLGVNMRATSGKLQESGIVEIIECKRGLNVRGEMVYEAMPTKPSTVVIRVNFPAIREGDMPANIKAICEAMTLDNKGGQVVGIDEKVGVGLLFEQLGYENYQDTVEKMYPKNEYDPDRTKDPLPPPIGKILPSPGGEPQDPGGLAVAPTDKPVTAATERFLKRIMAPAMKLKEKRKRNATVKP